MIQYAMTISDDSRKNSTDQVSYGLKATNEKGEEVLSLPSISTNAKAVEYLVEQFNRVKISRSEFFS